MIEFESTDLKLKTPFRCTVVGPSCSGKTYLAAKLIKYKNELMTTAPTSILCVYNEWQSLYEKLEEEQGVTFTRTLPESLPNGGLVLLDDCMLDLNKKIANMFIAKSHHSNCSVIIMCQALFGSQMQRLLSLNSTYIILMKNNRDLLSVKNLSIQMYPYHVFFLVDAYKHATFHPFSYLLIELDQRGKEFLRVRSKIFPDEMPTILYLPSKK